MAYDFNAKNTKYGYTQNDGWSMTSWSVSLWINHAEVGDYQGGSFISRGCNGGYHNRLQVEGSGPNYHLYLYDGGATNGHYDSSLTAGTWYHVAWTKNGATHKVYLNGTLRIDTANGDAINPNDDWWTIGCMFLYGTVYPDNGQLVKIAALKLWDGVVLNATEIAAEKDSYPPVRTSGCVLSSTFVTDNANSVGATVFTLGGSPAIVSGPDGLSTGGRNPVPMGFVLE